MLNTAIIGLENVRPASSNAIKMKLQIEYKRVCMELFENFGKRMEATAERWSERLVNANVTLSELKKGLDHTVETCERLPAYAEFIAIVRNNSTLGFEQEKRQEDLNKKASALRKWTNNQLEAFLENHTKEQLIEAMQKWYVGVYGGDPSSYGLGLRVFMPVFFQDMEAGNRSLHKAIEIGQKRKLET